MTTFDEQAFRILIDDRPSAAQRRKKLIALAQMAAVAAGNVCPECDGHDIGAGADLTYRCVDCGHQWDAES